jgi:hypothetical protein
MSNKFRQRRRKLFWSVLLLLGTLPAAVFASDSLVINEIFPNPKGSDKDKEFVELYNTGDVEVELEGWILRKTSKKGSVKEYSFGKADKINKGDYFRIKFRGLNNDGAKIELISNKSKSIDDKEYRKVVEGKSYNRDEENEDNDWYWSDETGGYKNNPGNKEYPQIIINEILPNPKGEEKSEEFIELYNPNKKDVDLEAWQIRDGSKTGKYILRKGTRIEAGKYLVIYRKDFKFALNNSGKEVVRLLDPNDDTSKDEYKDEVVYTKTTEGKSYNRDENIKEGKWYWAKPSGGDKNEDNPASKKYMNLLLSEILANPQGVESENEFIEIYNPNKKDVDLVDWQLQDSSAKGQFSFSEGAKIGAGKFVVVYRKDFKFALNNSGGEIVKLVTPSGRVVSKTKYKSAKEGVSYNYHLNDKNWRWSKSLTPGRGNVFNNLPTFKFEKPQKIYKSTYVDFALHKLRDKDGDKIKIVWDFGDGHKSYLKEAKHKYKKTGKYKVKLVVKDTSEEIVKVFEIKVRKYPRYKLKIVGIMPNPNGKDKGREIVLVKNREKKKVSLENYKIGTGKNREKILEHPFNDVLKIKSGEIKKIMNDTTCKFSLLNNGGVVQLVYPDGKIVDEIKYEKKKIFPNEMYKLDEVSGQWYWQSGSGAMNSEQRDKGGIEVLGVRVDVNADITLDGDLGLCKTSEQIKRDNWMDNWVNKWLF